MEAYKRWRTKKRVHELVTPNAQEEARSLLDGVGARTFAVTVTILGVPEVLLDIDLLDRRHRVQYSPDVGAYIVWGVLRRTDAARSLYMEAAWKVFDAAHLADMQGTRPYYTRGDPERNHSDTVERVSRTALLYGATAYAGVGRCADDPGKAVGIDIPTVDAMVLHAIRPSDKCRETTFTLHGTEFELGMRPDPQDEDTEFELVLYSSFIHAP